MKLTGNLVCVPVPGESAIVDTLEEISKTDTVAFRNNPNITNMQLILCVLAHHHS